MITAIAIDDEPLSLRVLTHFCAQASAVSLLHTFTRPDEALAFLQQQPVDLLFLDIHMPSVLGTDFYRALPGAPMVIFITAHSEYALEGFELQAVDYLLKPFTQERFLKAVEKARLLADASRKQADGELTAYLSLRVDYSLVQVATRDILYIEGLDDYLRVRLEGGRQVVVRMTLKHMLELLPANAFMRIHRSFIVPVHRVEKIRNKAVFVAGVELPVGSRFEAEAMARFAGRNAH